MFSTVPEYEMHFSSRRAPWNIQFFLKLNELLGAETKKNQKQIFDTLCEAFN